MAIGVHTTAVIDVGAAKGRRGHFRDLSVQTKNIQGTREVVDWPKINSDDNISVVSQWQINSLHVMNVIKDVILSQRSPHIQILPAPSVTRVRTTVAMTDDDRDYCVVMTDDDRGYCVVMTDDYWVVMTDDDRGYCVVMTDDYWVVMTDDDRVVMTGDYCVVTSWTMVAMMRLPRGQLHRSSFGVSILSSRSWSNSRRNSLTNSATWRPTTQLHVTTDQLQLNTIMWHLLWLSKCHIVNSNRVIGL